jgi:predicted dehydrogenase
MHVAFVGSGSIGRRHANVVRARWPGAALTVVRRGGAADAWSDSVGARVVPDLAAAIAADPDLAVVATPSALHADALDALLAAGVACYVEKPAVTDRAQLDRVRSRLASLASPPPTLSGCNLRFLPAARRLREAIAGGAIGRPVRASLQVGQWLPDWRPGTDYRHGYGASAALGGGVVLDLVHELDAARWLFGEFDAAHAVGGHYSRLEIGTEDAAAIVLGRRGGPAVAVGLDYASRTPMRRWEVIGDEASLEWDLIARRLVLRAPGGREEPLASGADFDVAATYPAAMAELVEAIGGRRAATPDLADGLASAELAIRANESLRAAP